MKSKMSKKLIAFILCMVLVICNSVSILADTPAPETATVEKQVKETKTANDKKASDDEAGDTENVSPQSEESAPEVKTTEKKEETTEATTQKKDEADEVTTKAKDETEKADETTTEAKETTKKEETTETQEEKTTKAKEETSETSGKKDTEKTTEAEEKTAPTELTYDDENVTVTVSAVAEGAIPADATLKVVPILKDDTETKDQYTEVEQKIQEKAAETETEIKGFLAYDITFVDADGNEIEPNSEVKVSMEYKEAALPAEITAEDAKTSEVSVMHLEEDDAGNVSKVVDMSEAGKVDTLETTDAKQVEKVEVKTESFSAFTITWTYKSGNSLKIQAHYGYMDNGSFVEFEESENYSGNNTSIDINWGPYYNNNTIDLNEYSDRLGDVTESYWLTNIKILNATTGKDANYLKVDRENIGKPWAPNYVYNLQSSTDRSSGYSNVIGFTNMSEDKSIDVYYIFNLNPPGVTLTGHYGYLDGDTFVEFKIAENETTTKELKTLLFNNYGDSLTDLYDYQDDWSTITDDEYRFLGASLKSAKGQDAQYVKLNRTDNNSNRSYSVQSSMNSDSNFIDLDGYTGMSSSDEGRNLDVYYVFEKIDSGSGGQGGTIEYPRELTKYKRAVRNDDGTYDLTLSISGTTGTIDNKTKIDVMMVLDVSGSMKDAVEENEDSKIIKSAEAIDVLVDSLDQDTIDARYNIVTFGTSSEVLTGWSWDAEKVKASVNAEAEAIDHAGDSYSQGTNYEAGMVTAQAQMARARANAMQVIVFLTDGQPTYYINDNNSVAGKGFETSINTLNNTLNAASNLSASKLYVIGLDMKDNIAVYDNDNQYYYGDLYHGWDEFEHYINASIDTDDLLQWICDASGIEGAKKYNETNPNNLANIFGNIAGEVATIACKNVTVTDTLSEYAEPVEDNPTLWIKLYGKNARGEFDFSTPLESVEGSNPTLNYVNPETGNVQDVTATYTNGMITLDFPDDYELNPDYTYEVGIKIQPTDAAYTAYQNNNNSYPSGVMGETDTGTHSGNQGFYSNENATVTYDYTESNRDPAPEEFPKPVIQISEDKLDNLEPVNFYLNLSSKILDTDGNITGQENGDFTTSVSGDQSGKQEGQGIGVSINADLKVKVPDDHIHNAISSWPYGVIGGESEQNAKNVDEEIRKLGTPAGNYGNQAGTEDEWYQIVDGNGDPAFPTDEEIFKYIRDNWEIGVSKGKNIEVNGDPIDVNNLTIDNFTIRWYVFKDQKDDCWHIDGILVPKSGLLNITKTFSNKEVAEQLADTFAIEVKGNFLGNGDSTKRLTLDQVSVTGGTTENEPVTYTWTSLAVFGDSYEVKETGYQNGLIDWKYESTNYTYTKNEVVEDSGNSSEVTIETDRTGSDEEPIVQTFAFTNNYSLKATNLDLKKTSKNGEYITGAEFKLSQKQESGEWQVIKETIEVSNDETVELTNLVTGEIYKLEEIQAPEAHMLLGEPIYFTVEDGTVKLCNEEGVTSSGASTDEMWSLNEEGNVLTIKNNILYDLPEAGGSGIYWYTFSGALLMMGAALIVYREKRKREVLLRK